MIVANEIHCNKNHDNILPYLKDTKVKNVTRSLYSSFEISLNLNLILFFCFSFALDLQNTTKIIINQVIHMFHHNFHHVISTVFYVSWKTKTG